MTVVPVEALAAFVGQEQQRGLDALAHVVGAGEAELQEIELMCFSTARLVRNSESPMAALLLPSAISDSTSRSRGVRSLSGECATRARASTSDSTIFGSTIDWPAATARIAAS